MTKKDKDPKGGLTSAGRAKYNKAGSNLKAGVKGAADTPEKMRRKGSFLSRMFGPGASGGMKGPDGKPSRRALSAAAWGEAVPTNDAGRARLYAKGQSLLARYKAQKGDKAEAETDMALFVPCGCGRDFATEDGFFAHLISLHEAEPDPEQNKINDDKIRLAEGLATK